MYGIWTESDCDIFERELGLESGRPQSLGEPPARGRIVSKEALDGHICRMSGGFDFKTSQWYKGGQSVHLSRPIH